MTQREPYESKMLEEVRRWRKEAHDERQKLSAAERQKRDEEMIRMLGLEPPKQADERKTDAA